MIRNYELKEECKKLVQLNASEADTFFDFKDCLFDNVTTSTKYINLRKWVQYWAIKYGDADQVLKTDANKISLAKIGWEQTTWIDCIYSFKTYFAAFLRKFFDAPLMPEREILNKFDDLFSEKEIIAFAKKNSINVEIVYELFDELDKMAKLTHTLGNYMPCFDSEYNSIKGYEGYAYVQDRIELLYDELVNPKYKEYINTDMRSQLKKWFDENKHKYILGEMLDNTKLKSYTFSNKRGRALIMGDETDLCNYHAFLKEANRVLVNRNIAMNECIAEL